MRRRILALINWTSSLALASLAPSTLSVSGGVVTTTQTKNGADG